MARPRTRKQKQSHEWSWRQFFIGVVVVVPLIAVTDVTGADDWPFWQYLLLAMVLGLLIGLAIRLAQTLMTRKRYGVWSWRPIQPGDQGRDS